MVYSLLAVIKRGIVEEASHLWALLYSIVGTFLLVLGSLFGALALNFYFIIILLRFFRENPDLTNQDLFPSILSLIKSNMLVIPGFVFSLVLIAVVMLWIYLGNVRLACVSYDTKGKVRISDFLRTLLYITPGIMILFLVHYSFVNPFVYPGALVGSSGSLLDIISLKHLSSLQPQIVLVYLVYWASLIWWCARLSFCMWFVVDRRQGALQSLRSSWKVTKPYGFRIYGAVGLIKLIESVLMVIPILNIAAIFWNILMMTYLYRAIAPSSSGSISHDERAV